jgi:hypothetical protein
MNALNKFVFDLVLENRKFTQDGFDLTVAELTYQDKVTFVSMLMKEDSQGFYFLEGCDAAEFCLFILLRKPDIDNKCEFADIVINKMFSYYEPTMQNMINDYLYEVQDVA